MPNVNTMTVEQAVRAWHDASEKYSDAGASDAEPRGVFADIMEALARDYQDPRVEELIPQVHSGGRWGDHTWALYSGHPKAYFASRELTRQAERVVKVARRVGPDAVLASYEYRYGRL